MSGSNRDTTTQHLAAHETQRPVQISPALARGAQDMSALFQRRTAALRAEFEARIHTLAMEREALRGYGIANPGDAQTLLDELEDLRQERDGHTQERAEWAKERDDLLRRRQACDAECAELRKAQEALLQERAAFVQEADRMKAEYETRMQEIIAAKDATIAGLEERIRWLEATQSAPPQQSTGLDQIQSESLDMLHSPAHSMSYPDMSTTLSTISQARSPMQVGTPSLFPLPLDVSSELDAILDSLLDVQVDERSSQPPPDSRGSTITLQGERPPPGAQVVAGVPVFGSTTDVAQASVSGAPPTRLVIRVPPSIKGRRSIKPPATPPTAEEMKTLVYVPLQQNSSDESSSATSPSTGSSSNTFSP